MSSNPDRWQAMPAVTHRQKRFRARLVRALRSHDGGSDEAYAAAEHEFPSPMGTPVSSGLTDAAFRELNGTYLDAALRSMQTRRGHQ